MGFKIPIISDIIDGVTNGFKQDQANHDAHQANDRYQAGIQTAINTGDAATQKSINQVAPIAQQYGPTTTYLQQAQNFNNGFGQQGTDGINSQLQNSYGTNQGIANGLAQNFYAQDSTNQMLPTGATARDAYGQMINSLPGAQNSFSQMQGSLRQAQQGYADMGTALLPAQQGYAAMQSQLNNARSGNDYLGGQMYKGAEASYNLANQGANASNQLNQVANQGGNTQGIQKAQNAATSNAMLQGAANQLGGQTGNIDVGQFMNPYMAFAQQQGSNAIQNSAASRGMLNSGATLHDLASYTNGLATQNYNNAAQNALTSRNQQIQIGNGYANIGQGISNNLVNVGLNQNRNTIDVAQQLGTLGMNGTAQVNDNARTGVLGNQNVGTAGVAGNSNLGITGTQGSQQLAQNGAIGAQNLATSGAAGTTSLYNNALSNATTQGQNALALGNSNMNTGTTNALGQFNNGVGIATGLQKQGVDAMTGIANALDTNGQRDANLSYTSGILNGNSVAKDGSPLLAAAPALANAAAQAFVSSDPRLKEKTRKISDQEIAEFLKSINPMAYNYKDSTNKAYGTPKSRQMGIMATDLEKSKMGGTLVSNNADGFKQVSIPQSVGALLAATSSIHKRLSKIEGKK